MARARADTKYVFVTGGVLSGVGKGITAASIGTILKARGFSVNIQKCDPYLNVDAGTLNPAEHGECFVTADGAETDLDVGHYERFLDVELNGRSSLMSGRVLQEVISDERAGKYLGKTVQIIPHVTNHIQNSIASAGKNFDVHIAEVGGTVGDYESLSFIEAIRELGMKVGPENSLYVHVVYVPYLGASAEFKTKPAQNAVRELRGLGIVPDVLVIRSEVKPPKSIISKLSLFSGVDREAIVLLPNAKTIYEVPLTLEDSGIGHVITSRLGLRRQPANLTAWKRVVKSALTNYRKTVNIGVIAKYLENQDTYMSLTEALKTAGWANDVNVQISWIDAEAIEKNKKQLSKLNEFDGLVGLPGFGSRGAEGKIAAAAYAYQQKIPYLGICFGMQMAVVALARLAGLSKATSTEFDTKTSQPVISTMAEQVGKENTGGTMRLGDYPCVLASGTKARKIYGAEQIVERHRHRYEVNNAYRDQYADWGLVISGTSPDGNLVEMIEAPNHPFFVGTQAHPELRSRPNRSHPLYTAFIKAALAK
ncbi:MAG TPA: CTP synthase [Candidatus Saccharimonadales bacterium]|nr:CTP synthase [Candidatus Saccharimonadales bacterium]